MRELADTASQIVIKSSNTTTLRSNLWDKNALELNRNRKKGSSQHAENYARSIITLKLPRVIPVYQYGAPIHVLHCYDSPRGSCDVMNKSRSAINLLTGAKPGRGERTRAWFSLNAFV